MGKYATKDQLKTIAQKIDADFPRKAGQYDDFTAGNAKQMVATVGNEDKSPYLNRTTGGSVSVGDRAKNISIDGCSIVVNQFIRISDIPLSKTENGITITDNRDGSYTINGTSTGSVSLYYRCETLTANHKVLVLPNANFALADNTVFLQLTNDGNQLRFYGNEIKSLTFLPTTFMMFVRTGITFSNKIIKPNIIDLTVMFGSAVADRLYALEQATAGSGISALRNLMELKYMDYTPNTLLSTKVIGKTNVGFNLFDKDTITDNVWLRQDGTTQENTGYATSDFIRVIPNTVYYCSKTNTSRFKMYDANKNALTNAWDGTGGTAGIITTLANCCYVRITTDKQVSPIDTVCFNLSWSGAKNGQYEAYETHAYSYGSDILRGIPKLDANNNIYFDGDKKLPSGKILRRYGIVDLGTLDLHYESGNTRFWCDIPNIKPAQTTSAIANVLCTKYQNVNMNAQGISVWITGTFYIKDSNYTDEQSLKTALSGEYLIYELATPIEEDSTPYQEIEVINDWGMEEANVVGYNEGTATATEIPMPLGHDTLYTENLHDKLQNLPENANADGMYVVQQTGSQQSLTPLATWLGNNGYDKMSNLSNGITAVSGITLVNKRLYKIGNVAILNIYFKNETGGAIAYNTQLCTLPAEAKPFAQIWCLANLDASSAIPLEIDTGSGRIISRANSIADQKIFMLQISYMTA